MQNSTPIIGKDVIESLTLGMYEDSKFIYREYIQNAADQIDKAIREGLLTKQDAEIFIRIEQETKSLSIEDNATGIPTKEVFSILTNIAQSSKERGKDKGFRGIGRLGGLAYCEKLVFETSFKGENVKSILTWDAKKLKHIINNRTDKQSASEVINEITRFDTQLEDEKKHYFKVTLYNVVQKDLLNVEEIRDYLSMVAPLPFANRFIFRSKIYEELKKENLQVDEYNIYVGKDKIYKDYSADIFEGEIGNKKKVDEIFDIIFFKEYNDRKEILFWGWYGIRKKMESLRAINKARGFRLRKANIQVGSESTLIKLHKEQRGNFYFIGEIHAFYTELIPNSRRDYFVENEAFSMFESKLKTYFHTVLYPLYHSTSDINSAVKKIEAYQTSVEVFENTHFVNEEHTQKAIKDLEKKKEEAQKAEERLGKIEQRLLDKPEVHRKVYERIVNKEMPKTEDIEIPILEKRPPYVVDDLSKLDKQERKFLSKVFGVINKVLSYDSKLSETLINRIKEEFK